MPRTILPADLSSRLHRTVMIDVRKDPARRASKQTIPGSLRRKPFDAETWWQEFAGASVVVFCVHGHEVSRAVAGYLADQGIDAAILDGGFEAWRNGGYPIAPIGDLA